MEIIFNSAAATTVAGCFVLVVAVQLALRQMIDSTALEMETLEEATKWKDESTQLSNQLDETRDETMTSDWVNQNSVVFSLKSMRNVFYNSPYNSSVICN